MIATLTALFPLLVPSLPLPLGDGEDVPWQEVLAPEGELPALEAGGVEIFWHADLGQAMRLATETDRPVFVTLRCLPCKQCAAFDAELLEGGAELDPLLAQFVTVRLTNAMDIDLRLLPVAGYQDLDLSWWGYLLSPEGSLYSVFGGRDHVSDETRISTEALAQTLERVLRHHYDERRGRWNVDAKAPDLTGEPAPPSTLPGYDAWYASDPYAKEQSCLHCHQVNDVLRTGSIASGLFDKERDLDVWPLPENLGIELDRDHGLRVTRVNEDSPAERAGLAAGDILGAANGTRLFGQADLRGVLHRAPHGTASIDLVWLRGDQVHEGVLEAQPGWRTTVLDWRMSVSQGVVGAAPGFFPNRGPAAGRGTLSVRPWFGKKPSGPAWEAGLRGGHVITAVAGETPDLTGRAFLVWFRRMYEPGDEVILTVREDGRDREIRYVAR